MEIGDLVIVRNHVTIYGGKAGIILDQIEDETGFEMCEVLIEGKIEWLHDIDLKVQNESR